MKNLILTIVAACSLCLCGCCSKDKGCSGGSCPKDKAGCAACGEDKACGSCCADPYAAPKK